MDHLTYRTLVNTTSHCYHSVELHLLCTQTRYSPSNWDISVLCHRLLSKWCQTPVVAMRDIVQMCFSLVGFSIQIELSYCGWICSVIYSLLGCSAFSDNEFCHPKSRTQARTVGFLAWTRQNHFFTQLTCMYMWVPKSGIVACSSSTTAFCARPEEVRHAYGCAWNPYHEW